MAIKAALSNLWHWRQKQATKFYYCVSVYLVCRGNTLANSHLLTLFLCVSYQSFFCCVCSCVKLARYHTITILCLKLFHGFICAAWVASSDSIAQTNKPKQWAIMGTKIRNRKLHSDVDSQWDWWCYHQTFYSSTICVLLPVKWYIWTFTQAWLLGSYTTLWTHKNEIIVI